jgi:putative FmdB family regulatory protein
MPIFDYRCEACGHTFDMLQKLGDEPLTVCVECGQPQLRKLLSAPAFHLKGKGWRKSDDGAPKKPNVRPKFGHTLDSAKPHAEHSHDGPAKSAHDHGHSHGHEHKKESDQGGGMGKLVREHVHAKDHGHSHSPKKSHSHDHGHSHNHGKGHKHD